MKSRTTASFQKIFATLPKHIKFVARKNYLLWKANPSHPSIEFKRIGTVVPAVFSVRVGIGWRALGYIENEMIIWFWIGSHGQYDLLVKKYR